MGGNAIKSETVKDDVWLPSVCQNCLNYCGIRVHRVNGVVVKIDGDPDSPRSKGKLCAKGQAGIMDLYSPYRLKTPLKRTNPEERHWCRPTMGGNQLGRSPQYYSGKIEED